jgi:hypothetical protein
MRSCEIELAPGRTLDFEHRIADDDDYYYTSEDEDYYTTEDDE